LAAMMDTCDGSGLRGWIEQTEDHVNGIKMIKRHMFGRASFSLLRKRILLMR
jgi:transposase